MKEVAKSDEPLQILPILLYKNGTLSCSVSSLYIDVHTLTIEKS